MPTSSIVGSVEVMDNINEEMNTQVSPEQMLIRMEEETDVSFPILTASSQMGLTPSNIVDVAATTVIDMSFSAPSVSNLSTTAGASKLQMFRKGTKSHVKRIATKSSESQGKGHKKMSNATTPRGCIECQCL